MQTYRPPKTPNPMHSGQGYGFIALALTRAFDRYVGRGGGGGTKKKLGLSLQTYGIVAWHARPTLGSVFKLTWRQCQRSNYVGVSYYEPMPGRFLFFVDFISLQRRNKYKRFGRPRARRLYDTISRRSVSPPSHHSFAIFLIVDGGMHPDPELARS